MRNSGVPDLVSSGMQDLAAQSCRVAIGGHQEAGPPDLLARACAGDREALEQLCRDNWLPVYRAASRWARTPAEAEDLTQEVFLRALRALGQLRDPSVPYRAYLLRIARNLAIDAARSPRSRRTELAGDLQASADLDHRAYLGHSADPAADPEAAAVRSDENRRLLAALDRLPADYSDVLRLPTLLGLSAAEVGTRRGQSPGAVRALQFRAMAALRRELAAEMGPETRTDR